MTFGSSPALTPSTRASATATVLTWTSMSLTSFMAKPCPSAPTWNTFAPMAPKRSWQAATVLAAPPTMIDSSPEAARSVPPLTGASIIATPRVASCSASRRATIGSMVLMQATMCPDLALRMMPRSPVMTASACPVVSTMQMVRSTLAATPSAESPTVAPRVRQMSAFAGSMSCTTSEKPCLTRFSAIGPPMFPSPMNPTVPAIAILLGVRSHNPTSAFGRGSLPAAESRRLFPLARAPGERSEVPVVLARGVVPVDPERVHVAPRSLGEGQASRGRVTDVVEVDRLVLVCAGNSLDGEVERPRNRHGSAHPATLDPDGLGFDPGEAADERPEGGHRTTALSAADRRQRLTLLGSGPLVHDHANGPVSGAHRSRSMEEHGEV